jgi:hypothetical protein
VLNFTELPLPFRGVLPSEMVENSSSLCRSCAAYMDHPFLKNETQQEDSQAPC